MDESNLFKELFGWLVSAALTVALFFGRQAHSRGVRRQDKQEADQKELERLRQLVINSVMAVSKKPVGCSFVCSGPKSGLHSFIHVT